LLREARIQIAGFDSRSGFDQNFETSLGQVGDDHGHQRDAPLTGIALFGNSDNHKLFVLSAFLSRQTSMFFSLAVPGAAAGRPERDTGKEAGLRRRPKTMGNVSSFAAFAGFVKR